MSGHIHTDVVHITVLGLGIAVLFHVLRMAGGYLGAHGMPGAGKAIGGIATFN